MLEAMRTRLPRTARRLLAVTVAGGLVLAGVLVPVAVVAARAYAFGGTVAAPPYFATPNRLLAGTADTPVPDPAYLQPGPHPVVPDAAGTAVTDVPG
jgi:hypothetical protein